MMDLFTLIDEGSTEERKRRWEELKKEKQKKINKAVQDKNLEFSIREYPEFVKENHVYQHFTIFICTKKGIEGTPDTLGKIDFTLHKNVVLADVFVAAKSKKRSVLGKAETLLHIDRMAIYENYRNFGLSKKLLTEFFDLYLKNYQEYPISIEFMNPVAEYIMRKVIKEKEIGNVLDEQFIQRFYFVKDRINDIKLIDSLRQKDSDFFPLESHQYMSHDVNDETL